MLGRTENQRIRMATGVEECTREDETKTQFSCQFCKKTFHENIELIRHQVDHLVSKKKFVCEVCGKEFKQKFHLTRHLRIHSGVKDHVCLECNKAFFERGDLIRHSYIHTGYHYQHACSHCNKTYTSRYSLKYHVKRSHRIVSKLDCKFCFKTFTDVESLKDHEENSCGERFQCKTCKKCFRSRVDLERHERSHTGEKPFTCSDCGKSFGLRSSLVCHSRTHSGARPYLCYICGKSFAQNGNMHEHVRKMHGVKNDSVSKSNMTSDGVIKSEPASDDQGDSTVIDSIIREEPSPAIATAVAPSSSNTIEDSSKTKGTETKDVIESGQEIKSEPITDDQGDWMANVNLGPGEQLPELAPAGNATSSTVADTEDSTHGTEGKLPPHHDFLDLILKATENELSYRTAQPCEQEVEYILIKPDGSKVSLLKEIRFLESYEPHPPAESSSSNRTFNRLGSNTAISDNHGVLSTEDVCDSMAQGTTEADNESISRLNDNVDVESDFDMGIELPATASEHSPDQARPENITEHSMIDSSCQSVNKTEPGVATEASDKQDTEDSQWTTDSKGQTHSASKFECSKETGTNISSHHAQRHNNERKTLKQLFMEGLPDSTPVLMNTTTKQELVEHSKSSFLTAFDVRPTSQRKSRCFLTDPHVNKQTLKSFKCEVCNQGFTTKGNLKEHLKRHEPVKPFYCDVCNAGCTSERRLKSHMKTHNPVRDFKCLECGVGFYIQSDLIRHSRRHTGEKPFQCLTCCKCFSLKSSLVIHERLHTGLKPYKCSVCHKTFTSNSNMRQHMKRRHEMI